MSVTNVNGYTFSVDDTTGSTTAKGDLQGDHSAPRNALSAQAGGSRREAADQGGHLVAAQFNGPSIPQNLFAQDGKLNQSAFKRVENAERTQLKDGASIYTERIAYMSSSKAADGGCRPEAFMINDTITYKNGETQNIHLSFANLSPKEQEAINAQVADLDIPAMPNPGDSLREQMSPSEYAELMESTDKILLDIKGEFQQHSVSARSLSQKGGKMPMADQKSFRESLRADPDVIAAADKAGHNYAEAHNINASNSGKTADKGQSFRQQLRADPAIIAKCDKICMNFAKNSGNKPGKTSASKDPGGRERGDDASAPGSLGRDSGYKGGWQATNTSHGTSHGTETNGGSCHGNGSGGGHNGAGGGFGGGHGNGGASSGPSGHGGGGHGGH